MKSKTLGFTLYELLITTTLVATIFGIAVPNLTAYLRHVESKTFKSTVLRNLKLARSYSINYAKDITVCGINNEQSCIKQNFENLVVFVDEDNDRKVDAEELIVRINQLNYKGDVTLRASFGRNYLEFTRDGSAKIAGSFTYCYPSQPRLSQRVTVSRTGRSYVATERNANGFIALASGADIQC